MDRQYPSDHKQSNHNVIGIWDFILPEVLEIVLQNLASDTGIQSLHVCRLINTHWKSVAETILERDCLAEYENVLLTFRLHIPRLWIPNSDDNVTVEKIWCPKFLDIGDQNPFPSKSLIVSNWIHTHSRPKHESEYCAISVFKLLQNHGQNLSSFTLHGVNLTSANFLKLILNDMKNLKALSFSGIVLKTDTTNFTKEPTLAPLPYLRTLKLIFNCIESPMQELNFGDFNLLLANFFGKTLTYLEIDDARELSLIPNIFPKLRVLKILDVGTNTFRQSGVLTRLKLISITELSDKPESKNPTFLKDLFNFLERFANTIEHLKLEIDIDDFLHEANEFRRRPITVYPNIKRFSIIFPDVDEDRELELLRSYFLPRFPALKRLNYINFTETSLYDETNKGYNIQVITTFLQRHNLWRTCLRLQSVCVFEQAWLDKKPMFISYRPSEYAKKNEETLAITKCCNCDMQEVNTN